MLALVKLLGRLGLIVLIVALVALAPEAESDPKLFPAEAGEEAGEEAVDLYILDNGWHISLTAKRSDWRRAGFVLADKLPSGNYLDIGWGDRGFYFHPGKEYDYAGPALFYPTPSVVHLTGFVLDGPPQILDDAVLRIKVGREGFRRAVEFINQSVALDSAGQPTYLRPGLNDSSAFFAGKPSYHFFRTCNVWSARALEAMGLPIRPERSITSGYVMYQLRPLHLAGEGI